MELLHICVRRTLPWHDEAAVAATLAPLMRPRVELWNATFNLSYAAFRHRLNLIARENWSRIEHARLTPLGEIPPGALVVPVDDDDWFSPELGRRLLAERKPSLHGYHWNRYILETSAASAALALGAPAPRHRHQPLHLREQQLRGREPARAGGRDREPREGERDLRRRPPLA